MRIRSVVFGWFLLVLLLLPSGARAHHSLQCTTGLWDGTSGGRGSSAYRGRGGIGSGMGAAFDESAFMRSGSGEIEVENPAPSSSQAFPGKRAQVAAATAKMTSATRAPASSPEPKPEPPERPQHDRKLPDPPKLPEPPRIAREPEKKPGEEEGSIAPKLL
jgi:hypothetical protein